MKGDRSERLRVDKGVEKYGAPLVASIDIQGIPFPVKSNEVFGDFWRPLAPGPYVVTIRSKGAETVSLMDCVLYNWILGSILPA